MLMFGCWVVDVLWMSSGCVVDIWKLIVLMLMLMFVYASLMFVYASLKVVDVDVCGCQFEGWVWLFDVCGCVFGVRHSHNDNRTGVNGKNDKLCLSLFRESVD